MNNKIRIFENAEFGAIRTLTDKDGKPWFAGKDVASALGYSNSSDAILKHVDNEDRLESRIAISGQRRKVVFFNESGLCSLILGSKLPSAKRFKRWVTAEVLHHFRWTGGNVGSSVGSVSEVQLSDKQKRICELIASNPSISAKQMSVVLSVTQRPVERNLTAWRRWLRLSRLTATRWDRSGFSND